MHTWISQKLIPNTTIEISAYFFKEVYVIKMARAPQVNSEAFEAQKKKSMDVINLN